MIYQSTIKQTNVTSYELTLQKLCDYDIMMEMHTYGVLSMGYIWVLRTQKGVVFCIWDLHKKHFGLEHAYGFGDHIWGFVIYNAGLALVFIVA